MAAIGQQTLPPPGGEEGGGGGGGGGGGEVGGAEEVSLNLHSSRSQRVAKSCASLP